VKSQGNTYFLRVLPTIPDALMRLEDVADDLWFAWNSKARSLFHQIDPVLWVVSGHNPRAFLRRVSQHRLNEVAADRAFLAEYHGVISDYDSYKTEEHQWFSSNFGDAKSYSIAYFSAEFGLHESLPIYSGGLGILAGDHCKSASDLGLPFTAIGLLYRQGYFTQTINAQGEQVAIYHDNRFADLCIEQIKDSDGNPLRVQVELSGHSLDLNIWEAKAGHIHMLLLDSDVESNSEEDRKITYQLYGGGLETRIQQEIVLGVGGVRALRALDIHPTVWHSNEGHAAFTILERLHEIIEQNQLDIHAAEEMVRASSVFTTHTPVPAGHDIFPLDMFDRYMGNYAEKLGINIAELHQLGHGDFGHGADGFNQTALAIHGSAYVNGVAKLHGEVSSRICQSMWPDLQPEENPVSSVTNGVHVTTWLAPEWINAFNQHLGGQWHGQLLEPAFWQNIEDMSGYHYWSIHQANKQRMLEYVRQQLEYQAKRNGESVQMVQKMTAFFDVRTLVVGFARRFATYKRATLLFQNEEKLRQIVNDAEHPIVFLFAGKAHPADKPGQELIRCIHEYARKPEFAGKILMLEGYDMTLSRYLISGVDVWLNNPIRPLEASGTSGMKAAMNGVPNLSILDGWWPEGFQGDNGWAIGGERDIADPHMRDIDDAGSLYHLLKREVLPTYYDRNESGFSDEWVAISKRAMITSIPHFNTDRMVSEYARRFYVPASRHGKLMMADNFKRAKDLAKWKARVRKAWPKVRIERMGDAAREFQEHYGESLKVQVKVNHEGLSPEDLHMEIILLRPSREGGYKRYRIVEMKHADDGIFETDLQPDDSGDFAYHIRVYPTHGDLAHPLSMGLMTYL